MFQSIRSSSSTSNFVIPYSSSTLSPKFYNFDAFILMCMIAGFHACLYMRYMLCPYRDQKSEFIEFPGRGIMDSCEPPWGWRKFNSGPLKEHPVLLTTECLSKSLTPVSSFIHNFMFATLQPSCQSSSHCTPCNKIPWLLSIT